MRKDTRMSDVKGEERMPQGRMPNQAKEMKMAGKTKSVQKTPGLMEGRGMPALAANMKAAAPGKKPDGLGKYAQMQTESRMPVCAPSVKSVNSQGPTDRTLAMKAPGKMH